MRTASTLMLCVWCACGPSKPAAVARVSPALDAAAPADVSTPTDAGTNIDAMVASAPPPDPLAGKSRAEQWAWALSLVPELSEYKPRPATTDFKALGLKSGNITLYTAAIESGYLTQQLAACTALRLKLDTESGDLVTRISLDGKRTGPDLKLSTYVELRVGISFGDSKVEGELHVAQGDAPIPGFLSEVSASGLRYDGASDAVHVVCSKRVRKKQCLDGTTQVCEQCVATATTTQSGAGTSVGMSKPGECTPCPPDPVTANQRDAINRVLRDQPMMRVDKGVGPVFYTRQADCKAALRKKPPEPKE